MINTPSSLRTHIGIFGKTNSGKSSLINAITGQEVSIVSDISGTTTDSISKTMEVPGLGPVVFIDTPGYDDKSILGSKRLEQTKKAIEKSDVGIFLFSKDFDEDKKFVDYLKTYNMKLIYCISKSDLRLDKEYLEKLEEYNPIYFSIKDKDSTNTLIEALKTLEPEEERTLTEGLVKDSDLVLLVMPQDIQAPKGRLILPQVHTIRDLLDQKALVVSTVLDRLDESLAILNRPPDLIITDSQCFKEVFNKKPKESKLTSFSVLFSKLKGNIDYFIHSVKVLDKKDFGGKILICEACTHSPLEEDIGRIKIPNLLKKKFGDKVQIDFLRGGDFWENTDYDLIVHCGGCMLNTKTMENRVKKAIENKIPMTNYGILIAYLKEILEDITY